MSQGADNENRGKKPSAVVQKYGRRGGSARKTKREDGSGFWQRVKDYVSPSQEMQVGTPRQRRASMAGRPLIPSEVLVEADLPPQQPPAGAADLQNFVPPPAPQPVADSFQPPPPEYTEQYSPQGGGYPQPGPEPTQQQSELEAGPEQIILRLPEGGEIPVVGSWTEDDAFEVAGGPDNPTGLLRILDRVAVQLAASSDRPAAPVAPDVRLPAPATEAKLRASRGAAQEMARASRPSSLLPSAADMAGPDVSDDTAKLPVAAESEETAQILLSSDVDDETAQILLPPDEEEATSKAQVEKAGRPKRHTGPVRGGAAATKVLDERDEERKRRISGSREPVSKPPRKSGALAPASATGEKTSTPRRPQSSEQARSSTGGREKTRGEKLQDRSARASAPQAPLLDLPTPPSGLSLDSLDGAALPVTSSRGFSLGISFGFSRISAAAAGRSAELLVDADGNDTISAIVCLPRPGEIFTGERASTLRVDEVDWCIVAPHRLLGQSYKDASGSVLLTHLAMRTFSGTDGLIRFEAHGEIYSVIDLCALLFKDLRLQAEQSLGGHVDGAVIAYPAQFRERQVRGLKTAAKAAGFKRVTFIHPAAAALLAHDLAGFKGVAAVYDFGGSSFDFSLLRLGGGEPELIDSHGDPWLGGDDFDNVIAASLADRLLDDCGFDVRARISDWQLLLAAAEQIKRVFAKDTAAECDMRQLFPELEERALCYEILRSDIFKRTAHLVKRSFEWVDRAIASSGLQEKEIGVVVASGGSLGLPNIRHALAERFGDRVLYTNAASSVTKGAAKLAVTKED
jgi:hypothetical protein